MTPRRLQTDLETGVSVLNSEPQELVGQTNGKSSSFLTEKNLLFLQEQLQLPTLPTARDEVSSPEDSQTTNTAATVTVDYRHNMFKGTLKKRGVSSEGLEKPANYDEVVKALNTDRKHLKDRPSENDMSGLLHYMKHAANKATLTSYVLPIITQALQRGCRTSELRSIPSAKWSDDYPLLLHEDSDHRLSPPAPDETIGYNAKRMRSWKYGAENMADFTAPANLDGQLLCSFLTVEVGANQSPEFAYRQNLHNGAVMLRNLRMIRKHAGMNETHLTTDFDGKARVCMVTFTKPLIEIHCGFTKVDDNTKLVKYHIYRVAHFASPTNHDELGVIIDNIRNAIKYFADLNKEWLKADLEAIGNRFRSGEGLELPSKVKRKRGPAWILTASDSD
jgi:hypothetical protein